LATGGLYVSYDPYFLPTGMTAVATREHNTTDEPFVLWIEEGKFEFAGDKRRTFYT